MVCFAKLALGVQDDHRGRPGEGILHEHTDPLAGAIGRNDEGVGLSVGEKRAARKAVIAEKEAIGRGAQVAQVAGAGKAGVAIGHVGLAAV